MFFENCSCYLNTESSILTKESKETSKWLRYFSDIHLYTDKMCSRLKPKKRPSSSDTALQHSVYSMVQKLPPDFIISDRMQYAFACAKRVITSTRIYMPFSPQQKYNPVWCVTVFMRKTKASSPQLVMYIDLFGGQYLHVRIPATYTQNYLYTMWHAI